MRSLRAVLALALVLVLGACATAPAPSCVDHDFTLGAERYRVTREHGGPSRLLLWREDGITWRLVSASGGL